MNKTTICVISDTHSKHNQIKYLPDADVIIHCGDITTMGYEHEIRNFFNWYSNLYQYEYKICIAGNHDWLFESNRMIVKELLPDNIIYLEDSEIIINDLKFYGTPVSKMFFYWAFNRHENKLKQHWSNIPDDTDILITHELPFGILDYSKKINENIGSKSLYKQVSKKIKPLVHTFGHNHNGHGILFENNITYINASILNDNYTIQNKPILFEIENNKVNILKY